MDFRTIFALFAVLTMISGQSYDKLTSFRENLLQNYSRMFRPLRMQNKTLEVKCRCYIKTVKDFDHSGGVLSTIVMFELHWKDDFIQWNTSDYNGLNDIHFPFKDVWMPNLVLSNPTDEYNFLDVDIEGLSVHYTHDGNASILYGGLLKTTCLPNVKLFPFDSQSCVISLTNVKQREKIHLEPISIEPLTNYLKENGQWYISLGNMSTFDDSDGIEHLQITIKLTRRATFLIVTLFIPLGMLLLMNLFVFSLPVESGEKASYSITILLSLTVFITIMMTAMPSVSTDIPIVSYFLLVQLLNNVAICVDTITSIRYYHMDEDIPIPLHLRLLVMIINCKFREKSNNKVKDEGNADDVASVSEENTRSKSPCKVGTSWITWKLVSRSFDRLHFVTTVVIILVETWLVVYYATVD